MTKYYLYADIHYKNTQYTSSLLNTRKILRIIYMDFACIGEYRDDTHIR